MDFESSAEAQKALKALRRRGFHAQMAKVQAFVNRHYVNFSNSSPWLLLFNLFTPISSGVPAELAVFLGSKRAAKFN